MLLPNYGGPPRAAAAVWPGGRASGYDLPFPCAHAECPLGHDPKSLYVQSIRATVTKHEIRQVFSPYGELLEIFLGRPTSAAACEDKP